MTKEPTIVFIYAKKGKIKVLGMGDSKYQHDKLKKNGWIHTATLDPRFWIQSLHNDNSDAGILHEVHGLSLPF